MLSNPALLRMHTVVSKQFSFSSYCNHGLLATRDSYTVWHNKCLNDGVITACYNVPKTRNMLISVSKTESIYDKLHFHNC